MHKVLNTRGAKGGWRKLGTFAFARGRHGEISFSNDASGNVVADAIKLVPTQR